MSSGFSQSQSLLGNDLAMNLTQATDGIQDELSKIVSANIIRYAINSNKNFTFDKLKLAYPKLKSMSQFMEILGKKRIKAISNKKNFSPEEKLIICKEILTSLDLQVKQEQKQILVSKHFYPQNAGKSFEKNITRKYRKNENAENYDFDWYVYENGVLTSEEKSFVKWFANNMMTKKHSGKTQLEENDWNDIFLARNEKSVKLYSWFSTNLGEGFEPDFVLFMKKDNIDYVFYIEPKGDWTYDTVNNNFGKEQWKQEFLLEIETVVFTQQTEIKESKNWRLIGLPFYNENNTKKQFAEKLKEKIQ